MYNLQKSSTFFFVLKLFSLNFFKIVDNFISSPSSNNLFTRPPPSFSILTSSPTTGNPNTKQTSRTEKETKLFWILNSLLFDAHLLSNSLIRLLEMSKKISIWTIRLKRVCCILCRWNLLSLWFTWTIYWVNILCLTNTCNITK